MSNRSEFKPLHHKATNRAYLWHDGKRVYLGKWGGPPAPFSKEVLTRFRAEVARITLGTTPAPAGSVLGATVAEVVDKFLGWAKVRYKGTPTAKNLRYYLQPLLDLYLHEPAANIGPKRLKELQALMAKQGRTRQGINKATGRIKQAFRWAVSEELILADRLAALEGGSGAPLRRDRSARECAQDCVSLGCRSRKPSRQRGNSEANKTWNAFLDQLQSQIYFSWWLFRKDQPPTFWSPCQQGISHKK